MLQRPDMAPERRALYLRGIEDAANRAAALTTQLLAFARRQPLKPTVANIVNQLDAISDLLVRSLGENIAVTLDLPPDLWDVEIDPTQFEMAILNVAVNARDAMPDGGALTIAARNILLGDAEFVEIRVVDTGVGMAPDVLERAFDPFFTTKGPDKGTGLGLSQVYGFATQSGGTARIEGVLGEGATVIITIPRAAAQGAEVRDAPSTTELEVEPGGEVLLVEDNPAVAAFVEGLLVDMGFSPIVAANAEQALQLAAASTPRIVLSDIIMPGMNGVELAKVLSERYPSLPIVLATGYSEVARPAARWPIVYKPFTRQDLIAAFNQALAPSRSTASGA